MRTSGSSFARRGLSVTAASAIRRAAASSGSCFAPEWASPAAPRAPYILGRFRPHFTLLANVPADQTQEIARDIGALFEQAVPDRHLDVKAIAVMSRPSPRAAYQRRDSAAAG